MGVPWQDIARRNSQGTPDLLTGFDADGKAVGGFQTGAQLTSLGTWNVILGDPTQYVTDPANALPTDPLMVESVGPRSEKPHAVYGNHIATSNPITSDAVSPPTAGYMANPINGHEWANPDGNDLQYACIFPLATPRDCSAQPTPPACDCTSNPSGEQKPLCQDSGGKHTNTQWGAKAYPSIRQLNLLKLMGNQAVVGSICPAQITNASVLDYGYRPFVKTLVDTIKSSL